jgi:hypothetical protein
VTDENGAISESHDCPCCEPECEELAVLVEDAVGTEIPDNGIGDLADLLG